MNTTIKNALGVIFIFISSLSFYGCVPCCKKKCTTNSCQKAKITIIEKNELETQVGETGSESSAIIDEK
jgi:hypothetical protein